MQRKFGKILSLSLAGLLLCGVLSAGGAVLPAYAEEDYYAPITATKGEELLGQIHDLITTTHGHYTTYADCRDYGHTTDYAEGGKMSIIEFYTHETIVEYTQNGGDAGRWNREHVWPKACSNDLWKKISNPESGGGADLHHIRPTEVKMNSAREDDKYGETLNGSPVYSKTISGTDSQIGGYHAGGVFEPLDNVKGDVARILFYVYTHYNTYSNVHGTTNGNTDSQTANYFGTLKFTNVMAASSEEAAIELLLKWNELDPVDDIETTRNKEVFKIQGNRNPFIDHPEYADMIWNPPAEPEPEPKPEPVEPEPTEPEPTEPEPTEPKPTEPEPSNPSDGGEKNHAALIGGIVGGVCGAAVIVAVIVFVVLRRKRK